MHQKLILAYDFKIPCAQSASFNTASMTPSSPPLLHIFTIVKPADSKSCFHWLSVLSFAAKLAIICKSIIAAGKDYPLSKSIQSLMRSFE